MFRWWYYRDVVFEGASPNLIFRSRLVRNPRQSSRQSRSEGLDGGRLGGSLGALTYMVVCVAPSIVLLVVVLIDAAS
jgi:hypothetical protein